MRHSSSKTGFLIILFQTLIISGVYSQGYDWRFTNETAVNGAKQIFQKSKGCHGKHFDWTVKQEYDAEGKLIMQDNYYQSELRSRYLYDYNKNGFDSICIQTFSINEPNDTLIERVNTETNDKNQLIEYVSEPDYENSSLKCYDFKYDSEGRVISYKYCYEYEKGFTFWRFRNVYINGEKEFKTYRIDSSDVISSETSYKFDKHGNKIQSITTSYYCTNRHKYEDETFDEFFNNKDLETIYQVETILLKWKYRYDSRGNWIRKREKHGLLYRLAEKRKIEY